MPAIDRWWTWTGRPTPLAWLDAGEIPAGRWWRCPPPLTPTSAGSPPTRHPGFITSTPVDVLRFRP